MKTIWLVFLALSGLVIADTYTYSTISEARGYAKAASADGKIMFGYGHNDTTTSNRIDIYDVNTKMWNSLGYGIGRYFHAAASADGIIMLGGGYTGSVYPSEVVVYNASAGNFSISTLSSGRADLQAAGAGQRILFAGGQNASGIPSSLVDIYFTNNGTWKISAFPNGFGRVRFASAAAGGKLFFGGGDNTSYYLNEVDIYNVKTDMWETTQYLSQGRNFLSAAGAGEFAVFAGGNSPSPSYVVDICNVTSGLWSVSYLSQGRNDLAASGIAVGKGFFFFGGGVFCSSNCYSGLLDIYDIELDAWHVGRLLNDEQVPASAAYGSLTIFAGGRNAVMPFQSAEIIEFSSECRARSALGVVLGTDIWFIGGKGGGPNGTFSYSAIDIFDTNTYKWSKSAMPQAKRDAAAASADGFVYVGGGNTLGNGSETDLLEIFNSSSGTWTTDKLSNRSSLAAAGIGSKIALGGGYPTSDVVDIYDVIDGSYTLEMLSAARYDLTACAIGNNIFFAGGRNNSHVFRLVDIYFIFPGIWGTKYLVDARFNLAGVSSGELAFFAGGENGTHYFSTVDVIESSTFDQYTLNLATPRSQLAAVAPSDGSYVAFGGGKNDLGALDTVEIYLIGNATWYTEKLSVASYKLAGGAVGTTMVFMAGETGGLSWSCAKDVLQVDLPSIISSSSYSSSESSVPSSSATSSGSISSGSASSGTSSGSSESSGSVSSAASGSSSGSSGASGSSGSSGSVSSGTSSSTSSGVSTSSSSTVSGVLLVSPVRILTVLYMAITILVVL